MASESESPTAFWDTTSAVVPPSKAENSDGSEDTKSEAPQHPHTTLVKSTMAGKDENMPVLERCGYNGPVYMFSGRRIPTERSTFAQLQGGAAPAAHIGIAWVCFNTELCAFQFESEKSESGNTKRATFQDLCEDMCSEFGLPPPLKARLLLKSTEEVACEKMPIEGQMLNQDLPDVHYFDIEHSASKKQKNSNKL